MNIMNKVLLIGGTDPSGAGLQTDWKVINTLQETTQSTVQIQANSIVTAVTAQNTSAVLNNGVVSVELFSNQLKSIENQAFSAIKIGMLGNEFIIDALLDFFQRYLKKHPKTVLILDPVLMASSGGKLLTEAGRKLLLSKLLSYTTLITPNLDELALLSDLPVNSDSEIKIAARKILKLGAEAVLLKGGHIQTDKSVSNDLFISQNESFYLQGKRWSNRQNVRGTGCALATAIATFMAQSYCLTDSIVLAKAMLSQGIRQSICDGTHQGVCQDVCEDKRNTQVAKNSYQLQFSCKGFQVKDLPVISAEKMPENANTKKYHFPDCGSKNLGIYPVVDSFAWIKKLVPLGVETIQLRIKADADGVDSENGNDNNKLNAKIETEIKQAIEYCRQYSTRLFINDHWQLAIKYRAYGIHLGQEDIETADIQAIAKSGCRLGLSTHSYTEVARAHAIKPSYLALGPIFATTSKDMPWIPQGVAAVKKWVELLGDDYPLVAIGGIDYNRAALLKATGVGSVAMISSITHAEDYEKATQQLLELWGSHHS